MNAYKIEAKWAILFTLMSLAWMTLEKVAGLHGKYIEYHLSLTNLVAIPAILMMVLALRDKKKNFYQGNMSYTKGLISGIILSVFIALLSPIAQWITSFIITPEYFPNMIRFSVEQGYYKTEEQATAFFNYNNYAFQGVFGALIMGIATTAIAMIFIRTRTK